MKRKTLQPAAPLPTSPFGVADGMNLTYGAFRRAQVEGFAEGKTLDIPTPWGHWGVTMKADGALELYAATLNGATRVIHIAPTVTNVVQILPAKM